MSYADEDHDIDDVDGQEPNSPKVLRQQNSKLAKELKELQAQLAQFQAKERRSTIADVLQSKGASPKLAKYVERDLEGDITPDQVEAWLAEEGELFGWAPSSDDADPVVEQASRVSAATAAAPPVQSGVLTPESIRSMSVDQLRANGFIQD
jgi:hypothetical protein